MQVLLIEVLKHSNINILGSFQRGEGAEQIDCAFKLDGWHYIVECRWRKKPANTREVDGLVMQVSRSGHQTMGLFFSINGWSKNVVSSLKKNPSKRVILMDGDDFEKVLNNDVGLIELLNAKLSKFNLHSEPSFSANDYLKQKKKSK